MKSFRIAGLLFAAFFAAAGPAVSQAQTDNLAATTWLVTVDGEAKTRTIMIAAASPKADGSLELQATYGFTGGGMKPIQAQISQAASPRQLTVITPAETKIVATERTDGSFQGTFALKSGDIKGIVITRLTGTGVQVAATKPTSNAAVPPGGDVPADCAAYYGNWIGRWSQGSAGEVYLRIAEVRSTPDGCSVRYSYSSVKEVTPGKKTAPIKDGTLTFVCNSTTGGTCVFERKSDSLWASYYNPTGGNNNGTFKRFE